VSTEQAGASAPSSLPCYPSLAVDAWIEENGSEDATNLFFEEHPNATQIAGKIKRAATLLNSAMREIREVFPDANYYSANDSFDLLLGNSHSDGFDAAMQQQRQVSVGHAHVGSLSGGDW